MASAPLLYICIHRGDLQKDIHALYIRDAVQACCVHDLSITNISRLQFCQKTLHSYLR
jgi:hypothetical protein